jgi:hypothetical protein
MAAGAAGTMTSMPRQIAGQRRRRAEAPAVPPAIAPSAPAVDPEMIELVRAQRDAQERTARSTRLLVSVVIFVLVWVVLAIVITNLT